MQEALSKTETFGIGEIDFSGREHLVAISAPLDTKQKGLMLYVLRYAEELRDPKSALAGIKDTKVETDELSLATQLINDPLLHSIPLPTRTTTRLRSRN